MENTEILNKMMSLCDSIMKTHESVDGQVKEHQSDVSARFTDWYNRFVSRYGAVLSKMWDMGRIAVDYIGSDSRIWHDWRVSFKVGNTEFGVKGDLRMQGTSCDMKVYRYVDGFSAGSCSVYYPLHNHITLFQSELFGDFLDKVDFSHFDKAFTAQMTDLAKIISENDAQRLSKIA
jgi:hypothetical protein